MLVINDALRSVERLALFTLTTTEPSFPDVSDNSDLPIAAEGKTQQSASKLTVNIKKTQRADTLK